MTASLPSSSPGKPLRLKDFLKEDTNSDSCGGAGGFRTKPRRLPDKTVRYLLAVELGESAGGDRPLTRCRSKGGALTKLTAVINAVKLLPFTSPSSTGCGHNCDKHPKKQGGFLSRSFSRTLRSSFWRKREHQAENNAAGTIMRVRDIVRLRSFGDEKLGAKAAEKTSSPSLSSPVRSTNSGSTSSSGTSGGGGGWSDTDSTGSDSFSCGSSVCCGDVKQGSPNMETNHCAGPRSPFVVRGVGKEEEMGAGNGLGCPCPFEEEKDQLSPVSVMDFPFEEDEDEAVDDVCADGAAAMAASPTSFHRSLASLEKTKQQLLQKIRDFESLAALVDPVDLGSRFTSEEDDTEPEVRVDRAVHEGDTDADEADEQLLQFQVEIEERAFALLCELKRRSGSGGSQGRTDELLVDFFVERLSCPRSDDGGVQMRMKRQLDRREEAAEEALLCAAEDWLGGGGGGRRVEEGCRRAAEVKEMEMNGRWRSIHVEEQEEIAGDLGYRVLESLVDELLVDLFQSH